MQNISDKTSADGGAGRELVPLAAGAALAVAAAGAFLVLVDMPSPLRAPSALVFMVVTPGLAVAHGLRGLEPLGRAVASSAAALALNLLVAQAMLAMHLWSIRGGVAAVAGISALLFLLTLVRRPGGRTARRQAS
ncbi:hypothetical protein OG897_12175 [Streptomyces sp. NBC_00237]|uniref:hypothetical protein n=1 Tax=Streptomyces sp. NBC_00237 TaxID=2975687 RepID=UPI00225C2F6F|nr:hypothetical protein [Streptomyces sp. NBC_00237]MCX5202204.1 hypothetical protein [Streptomyces sp. NBC_00237]